MRWREAKRLPRHPEQVGSWCSGITSASHAEGPGFKSQWVHFAALIENIFGTRCDHNAPHWPKRLTHPSAPYLFLEVALSFFPFPYRSPVASPTHTPSPSRAVLLSLSPTSICVSLLSPPLVLPRPPPDFTSRGQRDCNGASPHCCNSKTLWPSG